MSVNQYFNFYNNQKQNRFIYFWVVVLNVLNN